MTSPELDQALTKYQHLANQVNLAFENLRLSYPDDLQCRAGCHQCCLPNLSMSQLEAKAIQQFLSANPEVTKQLTVLEQQKPHQGRRCNLLNESEQCGIYDARPIICRSHGVSVLFQTTENKGQQKWFADVCELNFTVSSSAELRQADFLLSEGINQFIAELNHSLGFTAERTKLSVSELLSTGPTK